MDLRVLSKMRTINKVILVGYITEPFFKALSDDKELICFSVCTQRAVKSKNGTWEQVPNWINVKTIQNLKNPYFDHLQKGSKVFVEGELICESSKDNEGHYKNESYVRVVSGIHNIIIVHN